MTDMIESDSIHEENDVKKSTRSPNDKRLRLKENLFLRNPERSETVEKFLSLKKVEKNATLVSCILNDKGEVETCFTSKDTLTNLKALYKNVSGPKPTEKVSFSTKNKQTLVRIVDSTPQMEIDTANNRLFLLCSRRSRFNRSRIWKTNWQSQSFPIQDSLIFTQKDPNVCEIITIEWGGICWGEGTFNKGAWYRISVISTNGANFSEGETLPKVSNSELEKIINERIELLVKKAKLVGASQIGLK